MLNFLLTIVWESLMDKGLMEGHVNSCPCSLILKPEYLLLCTARKCLEERFRTSW